MQNEKFFGVVSPATHIRATIFNQRGEIMGNLASVLNDAGEIRDAAQSMFPKWRITEIYRNTEYAKIWIV
jgi:hypothetical protein